MKCKEMRFPSHFFFSLVCFWLKKSTLVVDMMGDVVMFALLYTGNATLVSTGYIKSGRVQNNCISS